MFFKGGELEVDVANEEIIIYLNGDPKIRLVFPSNYKYD